MSRAGRYNIVLYCTATINDPGSPMSVSVIAINVVSALLLPPLNLVLVCVAGLLLRRKWPRTGAGLIGSALIALIVFSTSAGALLFVAPLEQRTAPIASVDGTGAQAIVVLSGGRLANAPEYGGNDIPSLTALARLRYAARLHRETGLPLLVTGGAPDGSVESEAAGMARALQEDFEVPVKWIEENSDNTAESAAFSASILKQARIRRILLVTDAMHMPRSQAMFERTGLEIVAAPTILLSRVPLKPLHFIPNGEGLRRTHYAIHEWIGIVWYSLRHGSVLPTANANSSS